MSWIKLDDQWMDHPKIIAAGRDARDMWLAALTYCSKHLTDGFINEKLLPNLAVVAGLDVANCQNFARTLLDVGLFDATEKGYYVHDYLEYNPSKEQAIATREARKRAGSAGGKQKASKMLANSLANLKQKSAPSPSPSPSLNEDIYNSDLSDEFTKITGIIPHNLEEWAKADQELNRQKITPEEIKIAVQKMQAEGWQYSGLQSIVKTAIYVHTQRANNKPIFSDNGNKAKPKTRTRILTNAATGETMEEEI